MLTLYIRSVKVSIQVSFNNYIKYVQRGIRTRFRTIIICNSVRVMIDKIPILYIKCVVLFVVDDMYIIK